MARSHLLMHYIIASSFRFKAKFDFSQKKYKVIPPIRAAEVKNFKDSCANFS